MIRPERKQKLIAEFHRSPQDTGSVEVQIALMTERINDLNKHFEQFPKDYASRVGLMKLVGQRRRYLRYLERQDSKMYQQMLARLGLRG
jgi:small subunit ribosomal protein S15